MANEQEYEVTVRAVEVHRHCRVPSCTGEMKKVALGQQWGFEPVWDHVCTACGIKMHFCKAYPCIEFRPT